MVKRSPAVDWNDQKIRDQMEAAFNRVEQQFGAHYPVIVGGREYFSDDVIVSRDPADTSRVVGRVSVATPTHLEEAVAVAEKAFKWWSHVPATERVDIVCQAKKMFEERAFDLTAWVLYECSKDRKGGMFEVRETCFFFDLYAAAMQKYGREEVLDVSTNAEQIVKRYVPRGVTAGFPPSNFPISLYAGKPIASLMAGCPIVVKPSPLASVVGWHVTKCFLDAGVPPELISFLPGGPDIGEMLVKHPGIAQITFTGSLAAGEKISAAAAVRGRHGFKRVDLELGGNNPMIVCASGADEKAIEDIRDSLCENKGEKCSHAGTLIVDEKIPASWHEGLHRALEATAREFGHPRDGYRYGGASEDAWKRLGAWIGDLHNADATFLMEQKLPQGRGRFFGPVVVSDVPRESHLSRVEIFGPVLRVVRAKNIKEAVAVANASGSALTAGIHSKDEKEIAYYRENIRAGKPYENRKITGGEGPFGGYGDSGTGNYYVGSEEHVLFYLNEQTRTSNLVAHGVRMS